MMKDPRNKGIALATSIVLAVCAVTVAALAIFVQGPSLGGRFGMVVMATLIIYGALWAYDVWKYYDE